MAEQSVPNENRKSSYKGVCWHNKTSRWYARINTADKKTLSLGYFDSELKAAKAYDFAVEYLKLDDKPLNLPKEKTPDSVVRTVRLKLTKLFKAEKMEEELENLDPRFAWDGRQHGRNWASDRWAQGDKAVEIPENLNMNDLVLVSQVVSDIGALNMFFRVETAKDLRLNSDAKQLAWMTGFLQGAQDFWAGREDTPAPPARGVNLDEFKGDMRLLAENFGTPHTPTKAAPFEVSQPIYSEHCNPETLARDNAAIRQAMAEKTGIFGKMARQKELLAEGKSSDEVSKIMYEEDRAARIAHEKSLAEIDELLSGIL